MKIFYTLLICFFTITFSHFAQVDIEINDGLTVETSGSLVIEVSGDVIENGTGYLKGTVTSGDRGSGSISSFAGLTLTSGVDQITRTTGSALSSTSPKTTLRNYEVESTSAITADVASSYIPTGTNSEANGINEPYIFTKIGASTWKGYSDNGSTSSLITGADVDIPVGTTNIALSEGIGVGATILLEGPQTTGVAMSNGLTIPTASPYTSEAARTGIVPANAVDWVLVELRTDTPANTSVGYRSAFVDINGQLLSDDGSVGIGFPSIPGNYRIVIKHRNHLSVMSNLINNFNWISL